MKKTLSWRQRNKDLWNEYSRQWRKKRKEELGDYYTEYNQRWRIKHPERYLVHKARGSAKARNLDFDLTEEDIYIPEECPVLGIKFDNSVKSDKNNSPSIDRLDNSKGYTKDNVNVISWRANNLKSDGTLEEFKKLVSWMELNGKKT